MTAGVFPSFANIVIRDEISPSKEMSFLLNIEKDHADADNKGQKSSLESRRSNQSFPTPLLFMPRVNKRPLFHLPFASSENDNLRIYDQKAIKSQTVNLIGIPLK
jgi:hypothetical protein